jgi:Cd2+/Zn2+-exporting ATPase
VLRDMSEATTLGSNATQTASIAAPTPRSNAAEHGSWFLAHLELVCSIIAGVLLLVGFITEDVLKIPAGSWLIWASLAIGMVFGARAAWDTLKVGRLDIDVLMIVGAALAAKIGHPAEGALLLFLFILSGGLEDLAMERTNKEVKALHALLPTEALVRREVGGTVEWVGVAAEDLIAGDILKIRPGERAPVDARVTIGESSMDQAAITGESIPRPVHVGDELFAGTINTDNPLEAIVLRPVKESSLARILNLVTTAREQREPVQRTIDRLGQPYTIAVFAIGVATLLIWRFLLNRAWDDAATTAITLLIVASPCALVIATPTATLAAIARGARGGVLFKGGQSIERLARLGAVCFDKTGTLTIGRPRLYEVHPVAWSDGDQMLAIAAGLEADSTHPIATAIKEAAKMRGIEPAHFEKTDHIAGRGIVGTYKGRPARLGSYKHTVDLIPICFRNRVQDVLRKIQERGHIGVVVAAGGTMDGTAFLNAADGAGGEVAVLIMADAVRPGATELVAELHALNIRPVRMLTGDNAITAKRVAESLQLDKFDAELLPQDKLRIVGDMKSEMATRPKGHRGIGVIGDGVNDAPALALADVSMAVGAIGTAAAMESADIVLLSDNLRAVPWAVGLARRARRTVAINLTLALSVIVVMGAATLIGSLVGSPVPLVIGVLAHEGGTLLVVAYSMWLLRHPHMGSFDAKS